MPARRAGGEGSLSEPRRPLFGKKTVRDFDVAEKTALVRRQVLVLETSRFEPGETKNDPALAERLARLADLYVNDAFGAAHRAHATTEAVAHHLPGVAGFLLEREVSTLTALLEAPEH